LKTNDISRFIDSLASTTENPSRRDVLANLGSVIKARADLRDVTTTPLTLGFVVAIALAGNRIPSRRSEVFKRIMELALASSDKSGGVREEVADDTILCMRILDLAGYHLLKTPGISCEETVDIIGRQVANELGRTVLNAKNLTESILQHWSDRRVLEKVSVAEHTAYTFVHHCLCEYSAARYLAQLPSKEFAWFLQEDAFRPRWKDVAILTANLSSSSRMIPTLCALDTDENVTSRGIITGAALVPHFRSLTDKDLDTVSKRLITLASSPIPVVALNAGEAADMLPARAWQHLAEQLRNLKLHEYPWTRRIGWLLLLKCPAEVERLMESLLEEYESFWEPIPGYGGNVVGAHPVQNSLIRRSTKVLLENPTPALPTMVVRLLNERNPSGGLQSDMEIILSAHGHTEALQQLTTPWSDPDILTRWNWDNWLDPYIAILQSLESVTRQEDVDLDHESPSQFIEIAKVYSTMGFATIPAGSFQGLGRRGNDPRLALTIKCCIRAIDGNLTQIAREVRGYLGELDKRDPDDSLRFILSIPQLRTEPNWKLATDQIDDWTAIIDALDDRCESIAFVAASLLHEKGGGDGVAEQVESLLETGRENALRLIALIGESIWGRREVDVLLRRLGSHHTNGCKYVIKRLAKLLPHRRQVVRKTILDGLMSTSVVTAVGAAETLENLDLEERDACHLRRALNHWSENEPPYPKGGGVVPPSPRSALLKILILLDCVEVDELTNLVQDPRHDVREVAAHALKTRMLADRQLAESSLDLLLQGILAPEIIRLLISLEGDVLTGSKDTIRLLFSSTHVSVRRAGISFLGQGVFSKPESEALASSLLADDNPGVRNEAWQMLDRLRWGSPIPYLPTKYNFRLSN